MQVYTLLIEKQYNYLCIIDRINSIPYVNYRSKDRDS